MKRIQSVVPDGKKALEILQSYDVPISHPNQLGSFIIPYIIPKVIPQEEQFLEDEWNQVSEGKEWIGRRFETTTFPFLAFQHLFIQISKQEESG